MKILALLLAIFTSVTVKAQSLERYDSDFKRTHFVQGALTATGELVIAGALVASYKPQVAVAFWKKYFPAETAKLSEAITERNKSLKELAALKKSPTAATAETQKAIQEAKAFANEWKAEVKRLSKDLELARTAKLSSMRFVGPSIAKTVKVFSWIRKGVIVYALFDGATRTVILLKDQVGSDVNNTDLEEISPEELQKLLP